MSKRVVAGAGVTAFAVVVATVAVLASRGGDTKLQKLPVGSAGARSGQDSAASSAMLAPIRPVEYRVAGTLPALAGPATAYRLSGAVEAGTLTKLAKAFGLDGAVKEDPDGWVVHDATHELRVTKDAGLPWSYGPYVSCPDTAVSSDGSVSSSPGSGPSTDPAPPNAVKPPEGGSVSPGGCVVSGGVVSSGGGVSSGSSSGSTGSGTVEPAPPDATSANGSAPAEKPSSSAIATPAPAPMPPETTIPQRPADLPTKERAQQIATDLADRAGLDLANATVAVDDGFTSWQVHFDPKVGGREVVGMSTYLSIESAGKVGYASGFLGDPSAIGDYPLVGTPKGIERLKSGFAIGPQPMMGAVEKAPATAVDGGPPVDVPGGGAPDVAPDPSGPVTTLPPQVRTITGVHMGLMYVSDFRSVGRGTAYLVPAYLFTIDDGTTAPVIAVTDDLLATTTGAGVIPDGKR